MPIPHGVHGAVQQAFVVEGGELVDPVLGQELTQVVHLDLQLRHLSLHLPQSRLLTVESPGAFVVLVKLPQDDDIPLSRVVELNLDGGRVGPDPDELGQTVGSVEDVRLPGEAQADTIDDAVG